MHWKIISFCWIIHRANPQGLFRGKAGADTSEITAVGSLLYVTVLWCVRSSQGRDCGTAEAESGLSKATIFPKLTLKPEPASPGKDTAVALPITSCLIGKLKCLPILQIFFSSQLIVLPKLNDLFLELKEMQRGEKGTDKAQGREGW